MSEETKNAEVKVESKAVSKPSLFMKGDEMMDIRVIVVYKNDNGDIASAFSDDYEGLVKDLIDNFAKQVLSFKFTRPTYDKINKYRQRCVEMDKESKLFKLNTYKMRDYFLTYHLKEWDIKDDNGNVIKLTFDPNGALSDESLAKVYSMHPSILDIVLTDFERKMILM